MARVASSGLMASGLFAGAQAGAAMAGQEDVLQKKHEFRHLYAPHINHFQAAAGKGIVDQIKFAADLGFRAWEDNGLGKRPVEEQEAIGRELERQGMTMGVFVAHASFAEQTFVDGSREMRDRLVQEMRAAVEVGKRVNARWTTVVPDAINPKVAWDYQTANVIDHLRACAEVLEPAGLVMVLEPLNRHNHPGLFLTRMDQAFAICRAVNSPSCKILDDLYHQQITEGNLIANMEQAWDEIAYIQVGDVPGRKEPGTGEINYRHIFKWLHERGYRGVIGMEHGKALGGIEGERALVASYVEVDQF